MKIWIRKSMIAMFIMFLVVPQVFAVKVYAAGDDEGTDEIVWLADENDEWSDGDDEWSDGDDEWSDGDDEWSDGDDEWSDEDDEWSDEDDEWSDEDDEWSDEDDEWSDGDDEWSDEDDEDVWIVTFMDGKKVIDEQEVFDGEAAEEPYVKKTGYSVEWDIDFDEITEDLVVNAIWTPNEYKVTFNANGGKVSPKTKQVTFDKKIGKLPTPAKKDCKFKGWYTRKIGGTAVTADTVYKKASNQVIYAQWIKNTVTPKKVGKVALTSAKRKNSQIEVKMKKVKGAAGYEISYSLNNKFKAKDTKTITTKNVKASIKKVRKNKAYYIKARAYAVDASGKKVYGEYSKILSVKK